MSEKDVFAGVGLVVVDFQADFTEYMSGLLAVSGTDAGYVEAVRQTTAALAQKGLPVYFTQDWHPPDHMSFYTNNPGAEPGQVIEVEGRSQIMWLPHCVQNTPGAEILMPAEDIGGTVRKGMNPRFDSYSGFADDGGHQTGLDGLLREKDLGELIIYGLATDHCVKATVLDAVEAGYKVRLALELCRGVAPETTRKAVEEMKNRGVVVWEKL